jgi:hypothetical protein
MEKATTSRAVATFCFMATLGHLAANDHGIQPAGSVPREAGWPATAANIAGIWSGNGWGTVTLKATGDDRYRGTYTYTDTYGGKGKIQLAWSAEQGRFVGRWFEGEKRFGTISVEQLEDGRILGAWTADAKCEIRPGIPALSGLIWEAGGAKKPAPGKRELPDF